MLWKIAPALNEMREVSWNLKKDKTDFGLMAPSDVFLGAGVVSHDNTERMREVTYRPANTA